MDQREIDAICDQAPELGDHPDRQGVISERKIAVEGDLR
jgi:hypothetical protein